MDTVSFLRQFRIDEYAIFDFVISFLGIFLLSPLLSKLFRKIGIEISNTLKIVVIGSFILGLRNIKRI